MASGVALEPSSPAAPIVVDVGERTNLATKEGWGAFVRRTRQRPPMVTKARYARLSSTERLRYNEARYRSHRAITEIRTPGLVRAHADMTSHLRGSEGSGPIARNGTFLSGYPRTGKTTIAITFARDVEHRLRKQFPFGTRTTTGAEFIPVCYVSVGRGGRTKALMKRLYHFYAIPTKDRVSGDDLLVDLPEIAREHGTRLFIFDQLHNLSMTNEGDRKVSSDVKEMMETIEANFIGIGVGLEHTGLLAEGERPADAQLAQIGARFTLERIQPMRLTSAVTRKQWTALLATVESELQLLSARDGDLSWQLNEYIFERTAGVLGDVMDLLLRGANLAIERGDERITEGLLEEIHLSYLAEVGAGRETPGSEPPRRRARK